MGVALLGSSITKVYHHTVLGASQLQTIRIARSYTIMLLICMYTRTYGDKQLKWYGIFGVKITVYDDNIREDTTFKMTMVRPARGIYWYV